MSSTVVARPAGAASVGLLWARRVTMVGLARLVVIGFPLLFVVISWIFAAGYPYYIDNNESILHFVAARNLEIWDPGQYAWMTAEETDPRSVAADHFYTH